MKLNESLNEIYQKQSFAEIKWYPEILKKVSLWSINMLDERMSRDFTRADIISRLSQNKNVKDQQKSQLDDIKRMVKSAEESLKRAAQSGKSMLEMDKKNREAKNPQKQWKWS